MVHVSGIDPLLSYEVFDFFLYPCIWRVGHFFHAQHIGTSACYLCGMTTHYCTSLDEALKRAKKAAHIPGRYYGGITLPSGRKGFAVYEGIKLLERYSYFVGR